MKRLVAVGFLICTVSVSTLAGNIPTSDVVPPPPPPPGAAQGVNGPGEIPTGGFAQTITDEFLLAIFGMFAK